MKVKDGLQKQFLRAKDPIQKDALLNKVKQCISKLYKYFNK